MDTDEARAIRRATLKEAADLVRGMKRHYPESVFPNDSDSTDARSAQLARLLADRWAKELESLMDDDA